MKQMIVTVTVRGEDKGVVMHLDVPDTEIDSLIENVTSQCEPFETEDLGPLDDLDEDLFEEEYYDDEDEELNFDEED